MAKERNVAGITCGEVLERLGAYVDGELHPAERAQIDAHLAGCNWCEEFGLGYAKTVSALRSQLSQAAPLSPDAQKRLDERLGKS